MYFDNLTIAGLAVASLTALLPLVFGRETLRVREDDTTASAPSSQRSDAIGSIPPDIDCAAAPEGCR